MKPPGSERPRYGYFLVLGLLVFASIFVASYRDVSVVQRQDLDAMVTHSYASSFILLLYYSGSDDSYDYYGLTYDGRRFDRYRVVRSQNTQPDRMRVTRDISRWRKL